MTSTRFTVTSHLLNILVYGSGMVGEDVALNYDPHSGTQHSLADANKQSHSALPRPDNGWLVWGVKSTETGREQQLNVCVQRGRRGGESRHKCPCQGQPRVGTAAMTTATSPKMAASQSSTERDDSVFVLWARLAAISLLCG